MSLGLLLTSTMTKENKECAPLSEGEWDLSPFFTAKGNIIGLPIGEYVLKNGEELKDIPEVHEALQALFTTAKAEATASVIAGVKKIVLDESTKMYPDFLDRNCNDLLVVLSGRISVTLATLEEK